MPIRSLAAPLSLLGPLFLLGAAQTPAPPSSPVPQEPTPALTLHTESRIVLADVTVIDRHGNPVHGLTAQDFEVFDNDKPQRISSFEEHDGNTLQAYTPAPRSTGTVTNAHQHLPPVLNVILIDTTNLELPDQMYLRIQLTKFVKSIPPNQPLAVFDRHADFTVLLQPFTADRALIQTAINRAIPRIPLGGREYRTDSDTLRQIGAYLADVPGRKNVLWFSGGSTAYLLYGLTALTASPSGGPAASSAAAAGSAPVTNISAPGVGDDPDELRKVYDELEAARIVIYPVDARGLSTAGNVALGAQQSQMEKSAEATGGQAYFNSNGLAAIASHVISTDSSSYTLTWSPQDFHYDGKWHAIRIVPRNREYHLSYRRGYFADKPHMIQPSARKHTALFAGDTAPMTVPDLRSTPLLFEATVHPASAVQPGDQSFVPIEDAPARKGTTAFAVDYSLSTTALTPTTIDGSPRSTAVFAILALDADGNRIGQLLSAVRFPVRPGPARKLEVEQQINLPKGNGFLALSVWDPVSGHIGTLQVPVTVGAK